MHTCCSDFVDACLYLGKGINKTVKMTKTNNATFQLPEVSPL